MNTSGKSLDISMNAADKGELTYRCWSHRLWWVLFFVSFAVAYLVLRNFAMGFTQFVILLALFVGGGTSMGHFLGKWIDARFRTPRGLTRQERGISRASVKWVKQTLGKKRVQIDQPTRKKFEDGLAKLEALIADPAEDWLKLQQERRRLEQLVEEFLSSYRKSPTREYVESISIAIGIALLLRAFVIEAFQIPSGSMVPSLMVGDHIFVNKLSYGVRMPFLPLRAMGKRIPAVAWNWSVPKPGDVIVFVEPEQDKEDYIKRVVAVGGDKVEIKEGMVFVNDKPYLLAQGEPFSYVHIENGESQYPITARRYQEQIDGVAHSILCDSPSGECHQSDVPAFAVPADHVYVMGDNRDRSKDSRWLGPVPLASVKGRAIVIWWSYRENLVQWERMFAAIR